MKIITYALALLATATTAQAAPGDALSDATLLTYASSGYDKLHMTSLHVVLGQNHGVTVIADFPCSDLCPAYTVRIIHYDVPLSRCSAAGGVEKAILVPVSIASAERSFCFPKVLADHWDKYVRSRFGYRLPLLPMLEDNRQSLKTAGHTHHGQSLLDLRIPFDPRPGGTGCIREARGSRTGSRRRSLPGAWSTGM